MSLNPVQPRTSWGNTTATKVGSTNKAGDVDRFGDIDYDTLNRSRFSDSIEFNKFYASLKDSILSRLGSPVIRVELTDHQILTVIDEALSKLDYHAPQWCTNFMSFTTQVVIIQFRSLNSDTLHPFYINWVQKFATAGAQVILGGIRGKYSTLPSPGGGAKLNGDSLVQQGTQEMERLENVLMYEIEEPAAFTTF